MVSAARGHQPAAEWPDPLTDVQLAAVLRALAEVAAGDADHDFGTVLDVYSEQERRHGRRALSLAESEQVIRAIRASIVGAGAPSVWRSDLLVINKHLFTERHRLEPAVGKVGKPLPQMLLAAAQCIEASQPGSKREGRDDVA
jgi:hypothetical protein